MNQNIEYLYRHYTKRLKTKTMMFPVSITKKNNSICNRYRHVKMVMSIAGKICDKLMMQGINIDKELVDSIARLHDIGHTPFGHAGENAINNVIRYCNQNFTEDSPGYFKHNVFSAKILLEEYPRANWKLIDGVLKHSTILRKDFNILSAKEYNLIKLNYVFRQDDYISLPEKPFRSFIEQLHRVNLHQCYRLEAFNAPSYDNVSHCKKCGFVCRKNMIGDYQPDHLLGLNISSYLTYPYPLSYEGAIVFIADEIASFVSDISDYFIYLHDSKQYDFSKNIVKKQIEMLLILHESNTNDQGTLRLVKAIKRYIDFLINFKAKDFFDEQTLIIEEFIKGIQVNNEHMIIKGDKNDIIMSFRMRTNKAMSQHCLPLISFTPNIVAINKSIKNAIYKFIHSTEIINNNNLDGSKIIANLISHYYTNLDDLIADSEQSLLSIKEKEKSISVLNKFLRASKKIFEIYGYYLIKGKTNDDLVKAYYDLPKENRNVMSNNFYNVFYDNLEKIPNDDDKLLILERIRNIFLREVSYYVALLDDEEALAYALKYGFKI